MRFHGWRIAWILAATQTIGYGVLYYSYGVFTLPMEAELGLTRAQTAGAFSLALLLSGLAAVPIGSWVDARGARVPMSVGSLLGAASVLLWSYAPSLVVVYAAQAGVGIAMGLSFYDVAFTVIAAWFKRDRIRAMLVVTMVAGLASTIFIPLATGLLEAVGWRTALRCLALLLLVTSLPLHALIIRDNPLRFGQHPDGLQPKPAPEQDAAAAEPAGTTAEALRSRLFWWLTSAFVFDRLAIVAVAAHTVPLLLERGHSPALVAAVAGAVGLVQVAGRVIFAPSARLVSLYSLAVTTYLTRVAALATLLLVPGAVGLWTFAVLFGLANGASTLVRAGLVGEAFGSAHYGAINGAMATLIAVAQTFAPLAVGLSYVSTGNYAAALWGLSATGLLAAYSAWMAKSASAKRRASSPIAGV